MRRALHRFLNDRRGHTALEYSMMVAIGAIVIVTSVIYMGNSTKNSFEHVLAGFG